MFKIKADFGDDMERTEAHEASYAHRIARLCDEEGLLHVDRSGVEAVIEAGMRRVGDQEKLASQSAVGRPVTADCRLPTPNRSSRRTSGSEM
jgi:predicted ATP-dependent protease